MCYYLKKSVNDRVRDIVIGLHQHTTHQHYLFFTQCFMNLRALPETMITNWIIISYRLEIYEYLKIASYIADSFNCLFQHLEQLILRLISMFDQVCLLCCLL